MKKLVIYYSFEGNTRLIAKNIAKTIEADILELKTKKDIKSKGIMKYFWGGKAVMMKENPEILPIDKDPENYDVIFIGTPVWAWSYAPPISTFFEKYRLSNKKIVLFCCHGGMKGRIFDKLKMTLKGNSILGEIDFQNPVTNKTGESIRKAQDWAKAMIDACYTG